MAEVYGNLKVTGSVGIGCPCCGVINTLHLTNQWRADVACKNCAGPIHWAFWLDDEPIDGPD